MSRDPSADVDPTRAAAYDERMAAEHERLAAAVAVIVLAGGESRRFGSDKLVASFAGRTLLDHVLAGLDPSWDVICVGPPRPTERDVRWVREEPVGGGPLAGVAAGVAATTVEAIVVIAGDMPWAGPVVPLLLDALDALDADRGDQDVDAAREVGAAIARDGEGHTNPLLAAYRRPALTTALPVPAHDRPAKTLLGIPHVTVDVPGREARDVDRPSDLPDGQA
jgi:molybdopterin-guanine dinucleotide biosynthesis protein A